MISARVYVLVAFPAALTLLGCRASAPRAPVINQSGPAWPELLAGRQRQFVSDDVVIYANTPANAEELRSCVESELNAFGERYDRVPKGPGLVFALETATALEPVPAIEDWRAAHVVRHPRFYCVDAYYGPYFRESFRMPFDEGLKAGLLEGLHVEPAWICFLTTNEHRTVAAAATVLVRFVEGTAAMAANPSLYPAMLLSAPALPIMCLAYGWIAVSYIAIDADLMHLQRRETLWEAFIQASPGTPEWRKEELATLNADIDTTWWGIWERRPID